jgi:hypothetical protein
MTLEQRIVAVLQRIRNEFNSWKQLLGQANGIATLDANGELAPAQRWSGGGGSVPDASTTVKGIIRAAANDSEMGGSAAVIAVTPLRLRSFLSSVHFSFVQAQIITGDGSQTLWSNLPLNPGSPDPVQYSIIQVCSLVTGIVVPSSEITITKDGSTGEFSIEFATAPANGESYVATVIGGY